MDFESVRFITIKRFSDLSGISRHTVYAWVKRGIWEEGKQYVKSPAARGKNRLILVDLQHAEQYFTPKND